ncbi:hypothetical protein MIND_00509700 [Mycena indigotica]|uniref:Alkaline phytoceramidase n=1 Tax=Mycena indigotica TaxID=2126181 RepID=A0A8H6SXC6_9AGAR|nr:uncharacterized protein MIND_00509700 [Mycena indigotica]KAF7307161.1 hypothetical protein MIND_00509700 [Mycena indigotica]
MNATVANRVGYYGPPTSTLDWCEKNYQFSYYIAEMANSFSNIITLGVAVFGAQLARQEKLPPRFLLGYLGIAAVGAGSFWFHATLLYKAQLGDELPMIWVAVMCLWLLFDQHPGFHFLKTNRSRLTTIAALLFSVTFSWSYLLYRNPVYHQVVFGTLLLTIAFRVYYLLTWSKYSARVPADKRKVVAKMFGSGAAQFTFAFLIWNLDNIFCDTITKWKVSVGWPVAFLLEGHSWWHFFTATGVLYKFIGIQYLVVCLKDDPQHFTLHHRIGLPYVKRISKRMD